MKTKLTFAVLMIILTLAFIYSPSGDSENSDGFNADNIHKVQPDEISAKEKQRRIEYLLTGRSEKYESETDFSASQTGSVIKDTSEFGKGAFVMHCKASEDKPGYVLKGVNTRSYQYSIQNAWMNDTSHNWYIIPGIRIKRDLIYPYVYEKFLSDAHLKICRLEVVNTEGTVVSETEYQVKHFCEKYEGDESRIYYSGEYKEGFGCLFDDPQGRKSYTVIPGQQLNPAGLTDKKNTGLDYRIYWYGNADIWIDYIRVENDLAKELPDGKYDNLISSIKEIDIISINDNKFYPDQLLYLAGLKERAYDMGIILK